jgi:hypothetical protein
MEWPVFLLLFLSGLCGGQLFLGHANQLVEGINVLNG